MSVPHAVTDLQCCDKHIYAWYMSVVLCHNWYTFVLIPKLRGSEVCIHDFTLAQMIPPLAMNIIQSLLMVHVSALRYFWGIPVCCLDGVSRRRYKSPIHSKLVIGSSDTSLFISLESFTIFPPTSLQHLWWPLEMYNFILARNLAQVYSCSFSKHFKDTPHPITKIYIGGHTSKWKQISLLRFCPAVIYISEKRSCSL